ncbi:hypothetical protein [Pararhodospirillum photometricum]|uniref:hypothetical protein n=1 Tax=Pararhodospirillum photometricum TaxID=1084 RepID=UPI000312CDE0|nr:hypothetical protein [Pararhodospirillum photometricum]
MSTPILLPPGLTSWTTSTPASTLASVPALPSALQGVPPGTVLEASVLTSPTRGEVRLGTSLGEVVVKTSSPLSQGTPLTLTLVSVQGGQALVRLAPAPTPGTLLASRPGSGAGAPLAPGAPGPRPAAPGGVAVATTGASEASRPAPAGIDAMVVHGLPTRRSHLPWLLAPDTSLARESAVSSCPTHATCFIS